MNYNYESVMAAALELEKKVKEQEELITALREEFGWVADKLLSLHCEGSSELWNVCRGLEGSKARSRDFEIENLLEEIFTLRRNFG